MQAERPGIATLKPIFVDRVMAAKLFSVCPRTIATLTARGELPSVTIDSRRLYRLRDLQLWARNKPNFSQETFNSTAGAVG